MKRWIILAAVLVALSSTATVALQYLPVADSGTTLKPPFPAGSSSGGGDKAQWAGRPKAVVEGDKTFDFGTLPQQATGKHAWVVKNEGKGMLELWMISSTCSCTLAKFKDGEKAYVKPGESTEITLEYETRTNNGGYEKGAQIGTNDPDLPEFPLHVRGLVFPAVMIMPPLEGNVMNLRDIGNDVPSHLSTIGVYSKDRPGLKILKASSSDPKNVVVSWKPATPEELKSLKLDGCVKLSIDVKSDLPLGPFHHEVVVTTDHPKQPELRITVTGTLVGPVNLAAPGRLMMHNPLVDGAAGGSGVLDITVRENRETKFEVVKAPKGVTAEVVPHENPRYKGRYRLVVTVPPGTPAQRILDTIELRTDHPRARTVFVPVSIWIANNKSTIN